MYIYYGNNTTILNSHLINNSVYDFFLEGDCENEVINTIGTDNKPIVFYNYTVNIEGWDNNASEIILCGADDSTINNVKMSHKDRRNNGLIITATTNATVKNSVFNNSYRGIYLYDSYNTTLISITTNNNPDSGVYSSSSSNILITNLTSSNNQYGVFFEESDSNILANSTIENNAVYGIYLDSIWARKSNLIYNNLFNNTNNTGFGAIYFNNWNTTRQNGNRIYSPGTQIGGNYWTNPNGTGYSDICNDTNQDGFCDEPYNLTDDGNNTDYLPLSDEYLDTTNPQIYFTPPTEPNNSYISRNWTEINISITELNLDTFKFNWNQTNYTFYDDSLVLALNFNNNSAIGENSTYAVDISKYDNNGIIHGATWTDGKFGKALSFDGVDDYVEVPDSDSLNITDAITIELG